MPAIRSGSMAKAIRVSTHEAAHLRYSFGAVVVSFRLTFLGKVYVPKRQASLSLEVVWRSALGQIGEREDPRRRSVHCAGKAHASATWRGSALGVVRPNRTRAGRQRLRGSGTARGHDESDKQRRSGPRTEHRVVRRSRSAKTLWDSFCAGAASARAVIPITEFTFFF